MPRPSLLAWSCPDVLNLPGAIQGFDTEMDRADAIRMLQALAAAGIGHPRAEGKCVDREESLGNWIGRRPICQRPRIRRK